MSLTPNISLDRVSLEIYVYVTKLAILFGYHPQNIGQITLKKNVTLKKVVSQKARQKVSARKLTTGKDSLGKLDSIGEEMRE